MGNENKYAQMFDKVTLIKWQRSNNKYNLLLDDCDTINEVQYCCHSEINSGLQERADHKSWVYRDKVNSILFGEFPSCLLC